MKGPQGATVPRGRPSVLLSVVIGVPIGLKGRALRALNEALSQLRPVTPLTRAIAPSALLEIETWMLSEGLRHRTFSVVDE